MTETAPNPCCTPEDQGQYLCHCLRVTEADLAESVVTLGLRTFDDVRRCTGAGDGCTSCHRKIRECLADHALPSGASSALPICSDR